MSSNPAEELARSVTAEFRRRMQEEYVPRIAACVARLSREECWRRPGPHGNSIANLLLHLEGNVRQWILCGVGGEEDRRDRDAEFRAAEGDPEALVERLRVTVDRAVGVVDGLRAGDLLRRRTFQGRYEESLLGAVLHVLEHFSGHAGQIYFYTKMLKGVDLEHYDL